MKNKTTVSEIATSRVVIMFFSLVLLSLAARIYIMPFQKHQLEINRYFEYIEYAVIAITFVAFLISLIRLVKQIKNKVDVSKAIMTPFAYFILALSAFSCAVIYPLSHNRTLAFKYSLYAFVGIFIAYTVYYLLSRALAVPTVVCTSYVILFSYMDYMFTENINFIDKINIPYFAFVAICALIIIALNVFVKFVLAKRITIDVKAMFILSAIAVLALIVRCFILSFVSLTAIIVLTVSLLALMINSKIGFLYKK